MMNGIPTAEDFSKNIIDGIGVYLKQLSDSRFHGKVEIQFSDGQILLLRREETLKPALFIRVI